MELSKTKTNIVVYKEHTFGYIMPESNFMGIYNASVLRGATFQYLPEPMFLSESDYQHIRLATIEDFDVYRQSIDGFLEDTENYNFIRK